MGKTHTMNITLDCESLLGAHTSHSRVSSMMWGGVSSISIHVAMGTHSCKESTAVNGCGGVLSCATSRHPFPAVMVDLGRPEKVWQVSAQPTM